MSAIQPGESLDPPPAMIVQLLERVVIEQWPPGPEHFGTYFASLGCTLGALVEPDKQTSLGVTQGQFIVPGAAVGNGSWSALNDELFNLGFFAYASEWDSSPADVEAGYDAVRAGLAAAFGPSPDERTDGRGNRSAVWLVQGTVIELYAHVTGAPVLQAGASHEERTARFQHLLEQRPDHPKY